MNVDMVIPALNEALSIEQVVRAIPRPPVREIIVADNGSSDGTGELASKAGARVVRENERGYGAACLAALAELPRDTEIVVFMDADGSDEPSKIPELIAPIERGEADIVIGSRATGAAERGALSVPQRAGNVIASAWLQARFGQPTTDLGPFRAIRRSSLEALEMADRDYGWTVEMQIKAAQRGLRYAEIPVPYYRRIGESKVSGTLRGVVGASRKIIGWLAYHDLRDSVRRMRR
ncbi:MAG: glycosyltransferase family 2 protein [Myxococcota bacterium]